MVSVRILIVTAAAAAIGTSAHAADVGQPPPSMVYQPAPAAAETSSSGWYLRGDVGVGIQSFSNLDHFQTNPNFVWPASWTIVQQGIQDASMVGFGVGYEANNWLRFDITGEYRTKAAFKSTGSYLEFCPGGTCFDTVQGNYSAAVFMANAYVDIGTWWCLTPYVGGGVGGAYNHVTGVQDVTMIANGTTGFGYAADSSNWNMAWNVQAGLTYTICCNLKIDFSWRYMNLGSSTPGGTPTTGIVMCQNTPTCPGAYYTLRDPSSQDFRIGLRWMLQPDPPAPVMMPAPPLSTRG
jgi:opacity protein-like surface antigen